MRYFTNIQNNNLPPDNFRQYENIVFKTSEFHKVYYVKPMKDILEVNTNYITFYVLKVPKLVSISVIFKIMI